MVESSVIPPGSVHIPADVAHEFVRDLFLLGSVPEAAADLVADVLVHADMRGIRSHGVARIPYFLDRIERGVIAADPEMVLDTRTGTTGILDANDGLGIVASDIAMTEAMRMAAEHGSGFVAVRDSSHFGYAGYWAEQAAVNGMIGISISNSGGRVAPTFGTEPLLGTNPLAVAIPGSKTDFLLDMATSTVAVGKVETALREGQPIPEPWLTTTDPVLDDRGILTFDTALLPLGGAGTAGGGHKGYGLSLLVELLCGALTGTSFDERISGAAGVGRPAMGHFMGALRIDGFRDHSLVGNDMEVTFDRIRGSVKDRGQDRIWIQGEPESEAMFNARREGIVVTPPVLAGLDAWAARLGMDRISR